MKLQVQDTGIGVPEEDLPKILNRFYQVDKARSGSGRGAGLDLQICKRIVEAHSGKITAERNRDKGMKFSVTLPIGE